MQVPKTLDPFRLLLIAVAGWMNHEQQQAIAFLREENRVLRAQIGRQRLRFDDNQRRRLAVRAKALGEALVIGGCYHRDAGDAAAIASQADRGEVRR